MTASRTRTLCVAVLAGLVLFPSLTSKLAAPANYGGHGLTSGFGRGRLDLPGIVSEGSGGRIDLPTEASTLTLRLSGDGPVVVRGDGVERTLIASDTASSVRLDLPRGGDVAVESASRVRVHELVIERVASNPVEPALLAILGVIAIVMAGRGNRHAAIASAALILGALAMDRGRLSGVFAYVTLARFAPLATILVLVLPLALALSRASFADLRGVTRLGVVAFVSSLTLAAAQLVMFDQPLPLGDPGAYFEMGGKFATAFHALMSPLGVGPILTEVQPYLALPATGLLYGFLRFFSDGLPLIYAAQALAMATSVAGLVSIAEGEFGSRAGKIALLLSLLHPTISIAPGIVQPEPFILAAWTLAALITLRAMRSPQGAGSRSLLGAGVLLGMGLSLHPQGLSFLLLALILCLLPWGIQLLKTPRLFVVPLLGAFTVLLPVAAAEHFSKPLAYVLDKQYGFFAYTSSHPLGFWLYTDSDGWQGPLRIEDTTYQKELIAMKGEGATASTFADVSAFAARHPVSSLRTVLTNLHRLWNQPDNPFAVAFPLSYDAQVALHRGLVVLFVLSLPLLLGSRAALLALPFVMLSMTYPAYHVFNKYATPALPFLIIGASATLDLLTRRRRARAAFYPLFVLSRWER